MDVRNLTKIYSTGGLFKKKQLKAVGNISLQIPKDKAIITTLAGESGSGKSTIAKLLLKIEEPTSGQVVYNGKNLYDMNKEELTDYRKAVQTIFQDPYSAYNPMYKIDRVVEMPIQRLKIASSKEDEQKIIRESLAAVNLSPDLVLNKYPHQLSGGERQRVMISRALLTRPRLIIADEPVSMVDASLRAGILNLMINFKKEFNISFIYITHDLSTARSISDDIVLLYRGSIVESGDIETVINNPLHPYLRELIESIPIPDPRKRWETSINLRTEEITYTTEERGCKFYGRCPNRTEKCLSVTPQLVQVEKNHNVSCLLYARESN